MSIGASTSELVEELTREEFAEWANQLVRAEVGLPDTDSFIAAIRSGELDFSDPVVPEVLVLIGPVREDSETARD